MKLSISIVATNERAVLKKCLVSLKETISPELPYEIIVIDDASNDGTRELLANEFPWVKCLYNHSRIGFCKAHNQAIREASGEYILLLNADIIATKGFVDELVKELDKDPKTGIVVGKLILGDGTAEKRLIDTTGLIMYKNRQAVSRGHGEEDLGQYDRPGEIFAADGADLLCRREMLEDIKLFEEYLDESFYAFKEDQDLCWRARLRGWKVRFNPKAVAYHLRGWGKKRKRGSVPRFIRQHSFKNRYLLLIKNDYLINILLNSPSILWFELKAFFYMVFIEPHLLLSMLQVIRLLPLTLKKRREIMKQAITPSRQIRNWFI